MFKTHNKTCEPKVSEYRWYKLPRKKFNIKYNPKKKDYVQLRQNKMVVNVTMELGADWFETGMFIKKEERPL